MDRINTTGTQQAAPLQGGTTTGQGVTDFLRGLADKVLGERKTEAPPPPPRPVNTTTPEYVDDPTLDHNAAQCDPQLSQQRLVPEGGKWDGEHILNSQSQLETGEPATVNNQESRCGPSSTLAAAVMAGPNATARLTERLAATADPKMAEYLHGVRGRILDGSATRQDLSRLQEEMYHQNSVYEAATGQKGLDFNDVSMMQRDLSDHHQFDPLTQGDDVDPLRGHRATPEEGHTVEQPGRTAQRIDGLKPGQSFTLHVDTTGTNQDVNHFVQVGRDANGRSYVYDPFPRANQANVVYQDKNPQAFSHYTNGSMGINAPPETGVRGKLNIVAGATVGFDPQ